MSGYGYGPPPPPPPPPSASYSHQGQSRGGSGGSQGSRGRGGQYPRSRDHHAPPPAHYEYASQPYQTHQASISNRHHMAQHSRMDSPIKVTQLQTHLIGILKVLHSPCITQEVAAGEVMEIVEVISHINLEDQADVDMNLSLYHLQHRMNSNKPKADPPLGGKKKKRKVNTLGLTPGVESETEDDEGEEKALTELIGAESLQISDVAAFLAERRKNYPTKARVDAKKTAQAAQKGHDKTAELEKQADRLRKQLAKVESSIKRKREQGDEGDEMRDPVQDLSNDEKPEVMSSRVKPAAPTAPPGKKADVSRHCKYYSTGGTCGKKGKCRFVHDPEVREAAIKEREANNGRMTIQQRLILNDKEQEELAVLQSIQYIRQKGLMEASENGTHGEQEGKGDSQGNGQDQNTVRPAPATSGSSLLPAAPASLPAPPPKKESSTPPSQNDSASSVVLSADSTGNEDENLYEGWLLQPYRSLNGEKSKTDDLP
ncbi:hypothetical protein EsDP_00002717 [Epichloe bromicola]|uniref:C3H1-type domain-containing protein n=1 Tax=Epichloe bromicola TaxID=79588 RepID=A0ABQ0CLL6_9HYPO